MAYFDNAATTYPKPQKVYEFMDSYYRGSGGSAGRGNYKMALSAGNLISDTRERIQRLLHCPSKQVVFTPTATIALNIIIQGLIEKGVKNIYISPFEHNAVTRTLHHFEETKNLKIAQLPVTDNLEYDLEKARYQFDAVHPDAIIISHASNVIGLVAPAKELFTLAKHYGAVTLLDMAQTAGLVDFNVGAESVDYIVFAGHKTLYGPTGLSGFVMKPDLVLPPILFGGTGYDSSNQDMPNSLPEKYEMGTMNIAGIAGLNAALQWIEETSIERIAEVESANRERLIETLSHYDYITLVGNRLGRKYVGVVSALLEGISSDAAGSLFNDLGISVRTGLQCAPLAHSFLGTYPAGTVRFSVSYFTSEEDFQALNKALSIIDSEL